MGTENKTVGLIEHTILSDPFTFYEQAFSTLF
jgi:hypothetical protein